MLTAPWLAVCVLAGCNDSASPTTHGETNVSMGSTTEPTVLHGWEAWLRPLPGRGVAVCQSLQPRSRFVVLCPARTFVPPTSVRPRLAIRPLDMGLGSTGRRVPHVYEVEFNYGGPSNEVGPASNPHPAQTHTPALFFHFVVGGGVFAVNQVAIAQYRPGVGLTARRLGTITLAGRRGTLWLGRPWPVGGIFGGHLTFVWRSNGARYFASLHTWVPRQQTLRTLSTLVSSLEPANALVMP
jgi:hypothetical protein